jgi:hypothetical protein
VRAIAGSPFVVALCLIAGLAAAEPREVEIPETLQPGDHYELLVRSSQVRFGQNAGAQQAVSTARVSMKVNEGENGYRVVAWTYRNIGFQGGGPARPILERIARLAEGQRIEYYLNGEGAVAGIRNMEELIQFNRTAIDELLAAMSEHSGAERAVDLTRRMTEPLMSPAVVESQSLKVPQLFHFFSGISLEPRITYSYEEDLPTPVGVAIPSIGEFAMTGHDTDGGVATIEWRQFPDSDRASEATRQMVEMMLAPSGSTLPEAFDLSGVVIQDQGTFEMDLATGLPRALVHERRIEVLGQGRVERTEITLVGN